MAMLSQTSSNSSSSSHYYDRSSSESNKRSNTQASAYIVDAANMALTGLHFSTCGAGGLGKSTKPNNDHDEERAQVDIYACRVARLRAAGIPLPHHHRRLQMRVNVPRCPHPRRADEEAETRHVTSWKSVRGSSVRVWKPCSWLRRTAAAGNRC